MTDLAKDQGNKKIISLLENPQKAKEVSLFYQDSGTLLTTSFTFPHFSFTKFSYATCVIICHIENGVNMLQSKEAVCI